MVRIGNMAVGMALGLLLWADTSVAQAELSADDRNYRVIIDRNPFGLKPPAPPPTNAPPVEVKKDEIYLTGITSLGGLRAYFMTKAPAGKNPEYYALGVDEKKDALEVLNIDIGNQSVRVRHGGMDTVMTFAANGVKPPAGPAVPAPGTPGAPPAPGTTVVNPAAAGIPNLPGVTPQPTATVGSAGAIPSTSGRVRTIPSRNARQTSGTMNTEVAPPQVQANANPYAAETDILMMELQKKANPHIQFPPTPMPPGAGVPGGVPVPGGP